MKISKYRVDPGHDVSLSSWDTHGNRGLQREEAEARTAALNSRLESLQELLYAEKQHKILIVIQATDTGGKDGAIRHVFDKVNPQGVKVASFKKPTEKELSHDYLWRIHQQTPAEGEITIFNRSHYEDVLVVRVHDLVAQKRWQRRYDHINDFERMLVDEGTTILKFFLHISKDEQRERLQERIDRPDKNWKFKMGDLTERELWHEYQKAFTTMLERTSTNHATWWVIPADQKWFRNLLISEVVVDALEGLDMKWPDAETGLEGLVIE